MKILNSLFLAFAILVFSGCYTQLMIQDDAPAPSKPLPIVTQPLPPVTDPDLILVEDPDPIYIPVPDPPYIPSGYSNPASTAPAAAPAQRTSGVQRSAPKAPQATPQNTNRDSVPTRDGKR